MTSRAWQHASGKSLIQEGLRTPARGRCAHRQPQKPQLTQLSRAPAGHNPGQFHEALRTPRSRMAPCDPPQPNAPSSPLLERRLGPAVLSRSMPVTSRTIRALTDRKARKSFCISHCTQLTICSSPPPVPRKTRSKARNQKSRALIASSDEEAAASDHGNVSLLPAASGDRAHSRTPQLESIQDHDDLHAATLYTDPRNELAASARVSLPFVFIFCPSIH